MHLVYNVISSGYTIFGTNIGTKNYIPKVAFNFSSHNIIKTMLLFK